MQNAITKSEGAVSLAAAVSTPSSDMVVPFETCPVPSLVELTDQIISLHDALIRRVLPRCMDDTLPSALITNVYPRALNPKQPNKSKAIIVEKMVNIKIFFITCTP
jgi:hypothetical protein